MSDKDMAVMVKTLTKQNKAMIKMMKTQSDKNEIPGLLKVQQKHSKKVHK